MVARITFSVVAALFLCVSVVSASGPVGLYGIVEKVVMEPNEARPERVQVFGAFAFVDHRASTSTLPVRGYLYFQLPKWGAKAAEDEANARREWADLKAVAGTGQAIGFGRWGYSGRFETLDPSKSDNHLFHRSAAGSEVSFMRVHPASEKPASPTIYQTDSGIVKLTESSHAAIIKQLRDALRK